MNRSTPGLPVHHHLPEFTQTHVHWVSDAIQLSHPLSSPSPPAPNPSQHQSLFQWVNSSHEVAKVLELQLWHHSFQRTPRADRLQNLISGQIFPDYLTDFFMVSSVHWNKVSILHQADIPLKLLKINLWVPPPPFFYSYYNIFFEEIARLC